MCGEVSTIARFSSEPSDYSSVGFMKDAALQIHRRIGGLSEDEGLILAMFDKMPHLILNEWKRANQSMREPTS